MSRSPTYNAGQPASNVTLTEIVVPIVTENDVALDRWATIWVSAVTSRSSQVRSFSRMSSTGPPPIMACA
jgi:hypothetical protein